MQNILQNKETFTIGELAKRADMTVRNVRAYQTRGLLQAPSTSGRGRSMSSYGHEHLDRLKSIETLRQRGFSLAAIVALIHARQGRLDIDDSLGREPYAQAPPLLGEVPRSVSREELDTLLPGAGDDPALMAKALELGVIAVEDDRFIITSPAVFRLGHELAAIGIPLADLLEMFEEVDRAATHLAKRFAQTFRRHVWEPAVEAGLPSDRLAEITSTLQRMPTMTADAVQVVFGRSADRGQALTGIFGDE